MAISQGADSMKAEYIIEVARSGVVAAICAALALSACDKSSGADGSGDDGEGDASGCALPDEGVDGDWASCASESSAPEPGVWDPGPSCAEAPGEVHVAVWVESNPPSGASGTGWQDSAACQVTRVDYTSCVTELGLCCAHEEGPRTYAIHIESQPMIPLDLQPGESVVLDAVGAYGFETSSAPYVAIRRGDSLALLWLHVVDSLNGMKTYDLAEVIDARSFGEFALAAPICEDAEGVLRHGVRFGPVADAMTVWDGTWDEMPEGARAIVEAAVEGQTAQGLELIYTHGR